MNRPPVPFAIILALLAVHPSFAADKSWVPAAIRQIVESNPEVYVCKTDDGPEANLEKLKSSREYRAEFLSLVAARLKTAVPVSADEKRKLFTILLEPSHYIDPTDPIDMIMTPPNLECLFKTASGVTMMSVGNYCSELFSEDGKDLVGPWCIFSDKGSAAFAHWQHRVTAGIKPKA